MIRVLTNKAEWEPVEELLAQQGGQLPVEGHAVIFAEFDDQERVIAFQILHLSAFFAEGLWATKGAHLRNLWKVMHEWLLDKGCGGKELMTMVRGDSTGQRIGKIAEYLGCDRTDWNVYRRTL